MAYAIEVIGSNSASAWANQGGETFSAFTSGRVSSEVRVGEAPSAFEPAPRAQFATRAEAEAVALACRWANQTYRIKVVRGDANASIDPAKRVTSCQEQYGR